MMRITLKQLRIFVAVAQKENMSFAAQMLHLSQSACSMALAVLEDQLGCILFDRHGKQLTLNESGRLLLPKAIRILTEVDEFQGLAAQTDLKLLAGHLIVGASSTIGNYILPKIIGNFITQYSHAKILLQVGNTQQIVQRVLEFKIDMGLIEGNCYSDDIEVSLWGKDELVIIASPDHPLTKKKTIRLTDLQESKWILREPESGTRERFEQAIQAKIKPFLELGHTEAIKNAVQEGLGLSCLSKVTVAEAIKNRKLVVLKSDCLNLTRNLYLLLHKDKSRTILLKEFSKMLIDRSDYLS